MLRINVTPIVDLPKCDRCWHHSEGAAEHPFWPDKTLCPRCVGALLEIKWPPYIKIAENDYQVCADEADWHKRMSPQHPWKAVA